MRARTAAIVVSALLLQSLLWQVHQRPQQRPLSGDEPTYHARALALAAGTPMPPNFVWPPLGEWVLGGIYALFGAGRAAVVVVQGALLVAAGLLLRRLLLAAGLGLLAADVGMALLLLDPQVAAFAHYLWPEVLHLALALGGAALLLCGPPRPARMLGAGIAFGLALLTKSLLGPFLPVLAAVAALREKGPGRGALARLAAFVAGAALVTAPVVLEHRLRWGTWHIARSAGLNAWVGLNDSPGRSGWDDVVSVEGPLYMSAGEGPDVREAAAWRKVAQKLSRDGLFPTFVSQVRKQYGRLFDRSSFFTDQLPGGSRAPGLAPGPLDKALRLYAAIAWGTVLALSVAGLFAIRWRARWRSAALPLLFLAYNLSIFLLLHVKTRYRIALFPALLFFAAAAIADRETLRESVGRRWGALLAVLSALAFSFDL